MAKEICLVEVAVRFLKKGELFESSCLDNFLWESEPQVEPVKKSGKFHVDFFQSLQTQLDVYFTAENARFSFRTFGQGTREEWTNPLDWIIDIAGIDETFESWLPDLKKMALSILGEANKIKLSKFSKEELSSHVNFVTAWSYHGFQSPVTSYGGGESEEEWQLLGIVDLNNLPIAKGFLDDR